MVSDLTRDLITAARQISDGELMREKFVMGPAIPPQGSGRLSAGDNILADILADPELALSLREFLPSIPAGARLPKAWGLLKPLPGPAVSDITETAAAHGPDRGAEVFSQKDILPWGYSPKVMGKPKSMAAEAEAHGPGWADDLLLLRDFWGRAIALMAGAAVVGAAPLDERYLYTHSLDGRPILRLEEQKDFKIEAAGLYLPRQADKALTLGFVRDPKVMGMNRGLAKLRPAKGWLPWEEQTRAVLRLADWISSQGYLALPSAGGLLMAGHHGVLAGLGELGRQGLLISPEYGPNLRLLTIITDYPFIPGRPLNFGVADYCETCQRCIIECPAKALTEGHRRPGLFQWPVDRQACFNNWLENKDPCRKCIEVCPYTREPLAGSPGGAHRPPPN